MTVSLSSHWMRGLDLHQDLEVMSLTCCYCTTSQKPCILKSQETLSVVPDSNWFLKLGRIGHNLYTNHAFSGNSLPEVLAALLLCTRLARFFAFVNHNFAIDVF